MSYIDTLGQKAKACKKDIAFASTTQKNDALLEIAHILRVCKDDIIEANKVDLENGRMRKMSEAMLEIELDGLTGKATWTEDGECDKEPKAFEIQDGAYVEME